MDENHSTHHPSSRERGSALIAAIIMMVIIAALVGSMTIMTQRSSERSSDARRRVSNEATIQTAVTRIQYAFQNDLGTDQDYYRLSHEDLRQVTQLSRSGAEVREPSELPGLPPEYFTTGKVWEHVLTGSAYSLRAMPDGDLPLSIVQEPIEVEASVCTSARLPSSACASGDLASYWQIVRLVMPDTTGQVAPNVVVYIRSWIGSRAAGAYSKASYARAELRPGRFADYQQISDGNVRIARGATINGPVHSNGLADGSFSTVQTAPAAMGNRWIYGEPGMGCRGDASLSITTGLISAPPGCRNLGATGQTISFLRAIDSIRTIRNAAGKPGVQNFTARADERGPEGRVEPYGTAWDVTLAGDTMVVRKPNNGRVGTIRLGRVNAFVFDEDVKVRGRVSPNTRVTIAAERDGGASATIFIDGNLTKDDDVSSAIGLIAQGDIVLWMSNNRDYRYGRPNLVCNALTVQAAMVAATGGLTIPTRYTTDEMQQDAPECGRRVVIDGSVAGHRPPTLIWAWPTARPSNEKAGYTGQRDYQWDKQLKRNPPPYFPLTGTWQPFQVREANTDCISDPARATDTKCA